MAWLGADIWKQRAAITIIAPADTAGDYDVVIPPEWDAFWDAIDASGNELRVTDALGTALDYALAGGFSKTTRTGTIRINNYAQPIGASGATLAWLYFDSVSTQGSGAGTTGTGGRSGYIELSSPSGAVFAHRPPVAGLTKPPQRTHKTAAERKALWIGFGRTLGQSFSPLYGGSLNEEIYYVSHDVLDSAGASTASMVEASSLRFVFIARGPLAGVWVRALVIAGTSSNVYTSTLLTRVVAPSTGTSLIRSTIDTRIGVFVRDVRET